MAKSNNAGLVDGTTAGEMWNQFYGPPTDDIVTLEVIRRLVSGRDTVRPTKHTRLAMVIVIIHVVAVAAPVAVVAVIVCFYCCSAP